MPGRRRALPIIVNAPREAAEERKKAPSQYGTRSRPSRDEGTRKEASSRRRPGPMNGCPLQAAKAYSPAAASAVVMGPGLRRDDLMASLPASAQPRWFSQDSQ